MLELGETLGAKNGGHNHVPRGQGTGTKARSSHRDLSEKDPESPAAAEFITLRAAASGQTNIPRSSPSPFGSDAINSRILPP